MSACSEKVSLIEPIVSSNQLFRHSKGTGLSPTSHFFSNVSYETNEHYVLEKCSKVYYVSSPASTFKELSGKSLSPEAHQARRSVTNPFSDSSPYFSGPSRLLCSSEYSKCKHTVQ